MSSSDLTLVQYLFEAGLLTRAQLQHMQAEQQKWGGKLHHFASELGMVREDQVCAVLSRALKLPTLSLAEQPLDRAALGLVQPADCERLMVYPLALRDDGKTLWLAMSDPLDVEAIDHVRARAGVARVQPVVAGKREVLARVHRSYTLLGRDTSKLDLSAGGPVEDEFKLVDVAGRTQVHHIHDVVAAHAATPAPPARGSAPAAGDPLRPSPTPGVPAATSAQPPAPRPRPAFAALLLGAGVVDPATLGRASAIAVSGDVPVVFALTRWRLVDPAMIAGALSIALGMQVFALDSLGPALGQAPALPVARAACMRMRVLPVWRQGSVVALAMSDPTDDVSVAALAHAHQVAIERLLVNDDDLERVFQLLALRGNAGLSGLGAGPAPTMGAWPGHPGPAGIAPQAATQHMAAWPGGPASFSNPPVLAAPSAGAPAVAAPPAHTGARAGMTPTMPAAPSTHVGLLSLVEGVAADGSVEAAGFADGPAKAGRGATRLVLELAGATLESVADEDDPRPHAGGVPGNEATLAEDVLSTLSVLVVASAKNAAVVRAGLLPRLRELVTVTRFSEAEALSAERAFHQVVVVEPPEGAARSKPFAALAAQARRSVLVVGGSPVVGRLAHVRQVPRGDGDGAVVDAIVVHLRGAVGG
ncbi:MAG: hypothetical protein FJ137_09510 [Deltaproteobacteria bacterium]|nr:hypothetical protein [Deltaproteobacteria bacterium]